MFRFSVIGLALVFSAPTIWDALAEQTVGVQTALIRFLITLPIAAVLLAVVRTAMKPTQHKREPSSARRRPDPR